MRRVEPVRSHARYYIFIPAFSLYLSIKVMYILLILETVHVDGKASYSLSLLRSSYTL